VSYIELNFVRCFCIYFSLGKLLRIGRTGWDKASTLVQRAVGRVTVTSANNKGGTKINSSRNATNSTQNNSKSTQVCLFEVFI
jgi:hypothetical protein